MKVNFRNFIAVAAVLAIPAFFTATAHATSFTVDFSVWAGASTYPNSITPTTVAALGTPNITGFLNNATTGPINFYSANDQNLGDVGGTSFLLTSYNPLGVYNGDTGNYTTGGDQVCAHEPAPGETCGINNDVMDFTGATYLMHNAVYSVTHDDGMLLYIGGTTNTNGALVIDSGSPTAADVSTFTWTGASGENNFSLWYAEVNGAPAVLSAPGLAATPEPPSLLLLGTGLFGLAFLLFRRKIVKPISSPTMIA